MKNATKAIMENCISRRPELKPCQPQLFRAANIMIECFAAGGKMLICGNGGSASDAQHIVGELMKSFVLPRPLPEESANRLRVYGPRGQRLADGLQGALPALSLAGEQALQTAFSNDVDPTLAFAQQVYGHGRKGDVLLAISASGNSENILCASITARSLGMEVVALTGASGGQLKRFATCILSVPSDITFLIQEYHISLYHSLCLALEEEFFG